MAKRFETVKEYPAYDVITFAAGVQPKVYDDEILTGATHMDNWILSSVTGYAIKNGDDPIKAYNKAIKNGHETHYAFSGGAMLTDGPKVKEQRRILVNYGDKIIFHDQEFIVEKANNRNIILRKAV